MNTGKFTTRNLRIVSDANQLLKTLDTVKDAVNSEHLAKLNSSEEVRSELSYLLLADLVKLQRACTPKDSAAADSAAAEDDSAAAEDDPAAAEEDSALRE